VERCTVLLHSQRVYRLVLIMLSIIIMGMTSQKHLSIVLEEWGEMDTSGRVSIIARLA